MTKKYSNTNIRLCESLMEMESTEIGLVMYHEFMHMTSSCGDIGYSKVNGVEMAINDPEKARTTANNYMLYAAQNSMSKGQYE